jgi:hypothetical protein
MVCFQSSRRSLVIPSVSVITIKYATVLLNTVYRKGQLNTKTKILISISCFPINFPNYHITKYQ